MSRQWRLGILSVALATTAQAQTVANERERAQRLATQLAELEARMDSLARLEDTIEVEGVRFAFPPEHRAIAAEAARRGLAELERSLGVADRQLFNGQVFRIDAGGPGSAGMRRAIGTIVSQAGSHLHELGGIELRRWGGWWGPREYDLQATYLGLVTSPAAAATHCFEGDMAECARVLGLRAVADPWIELFDPGGRRIWVSRRLRWLRWTTRGGETARAADQFRLCVDGGVDGACLDLLHQEDLPLSLLLTSSAMRSIMLVTRELGGEGTFTRLVADTTAPLAARLSAAATVPLDSLLAIWRGRVMAAEPPSTRVGPVAGWLSLIVVVLTGTLALRSTRWRLA